MSDILIIDGNKNFTRGLERALTAHDLPSNSCNQLSQAMGLLHTGDYKAVLLGDDLADRPSFEYLSTIRAIPSFPEVIMVSKDRDPDTGEKAIQSGAWHYITKPPNIQRLVVLVKRVIEYHRKRYECGMSCSLDRTGIIGSSRPMMACMDRLAQAAGSEANVLITGETGTGKELFARAIHKNSVRAKKNFVVVDCAALPDTLAENLLFGHERGAFTSADATSIGMIKQADGGTLFLDEVGEMPLSLQKVFLRVLEGHSFRPVGSGKEKFSDFRLLSATNRDLETMIKQDEFRRDLFFRLRGIRLQLPPLRLITEDINELAEYFLEQKIKKLGVESKTFSPDFLDALMTYSWPGNIRELQHAIKQAVTRSDRENVLYPRHLSRGIRAQLTRLSLEERQQKESQYTTSEPASIEEFPTLKEYRALQMEVLEKKYLHDMLDISGGDIKESCRISGLSRARLYALLKQYRISRNRD
ncbi:sigma-54-dependent transcriptional regulator [Maridesulfovibrio sp.]|uniref:sigma-54-dependent transcriptional regulator n=1 Tax=Maridesulfovibrio sp. TaxID=2795000 RepID=UPI003BAAB6B7